MEEKISTTKKYEMKSPIDSVIVDCIIEHFNRQSMEKKSEVLTGKDKGKKGEVIEIYRVKNRAKVKGINIIKKHEKTTKEKKGGIISKENFIDISNLKNVDTKVDKPKTKEKK